MMGCCIFLFVTTVTKTRDTLPEDNTQYIYKALYESKVQIG